MTERKEDRKPDLHSREAKLAQALRANLRRRKVADAAPPAQKPHEKAAD